MRNDMTLDKLLELLNGIKANTRLPKAPRDCALLASQAISYLEGISDPKLFRQQVEAACRELQATDDKQRVIPILDALLASLFYFQMANRAIWRKRRWQERFNQTFSLFCQGLLDWLEASDGQEAPFTIDRERLFDSLEIHRVRDFSAKEVGDNLIWQYQLLATSDLTQSYSLIRHIHNTHQREAFLALFRPVGYIYQTARAIACLAGCYLACSLMILFYRFYVELPQFRLLFHAGLYQYKSQMAELNILYHSFWKQLLLVYSHPLCLILGCALIMALTDAFGKWYVGKNTGKGKIGLSI